MSQFGHFAHLDALLVEPSAMQAKIIAHACQELGILRLRTVDGGKAALAAMEEAKPDVVISALYLPDMSGTELVQAMRDTPDLEHVAFILVSSETRPQALDPVRQSGVCGILPKPFTTEQLRKALMNTAEFLAEDQMVGGDFEPESLRVMLVDDSPNARKFMRRVLENLGVQHFVEAGDGREAAAILGETMVDLVVTDYNMPEMDGRELVDFIRKQSWQQSVPILMVTSETNNSRLAAVEEAGVSGICDKPFEPDMVRRLLGNILGGR
ncbi:MAG TPA: response regulator [Rhodocyclaceae bacterium]|jgi:two-component system chemotaxis response regulator CheY